MFAFGFVGFACFCFLLYFLLLLFPISSFYVLVLVCVVVGFLGFIVCYLLDLFSFLFFEVKGRVRWLGPSLFVFFCFWFVLIIIVLFFGFVFLIWLTGFKGQVRLPKGRPHLAPNPPY